MVNHDVKIRFRHSSGDMGPFFFAPGCKVKDLKERLYQEWPTGEGDAGDTVCLTKWCTDGSFGAPPKCADEVAVILGGRFLDEAEEVAGGCRASGASALHACGTQACSSILATSNPPRPLPCMHSYAVSTQPNHMVRNVWSFGLFCNNALSQVALRPRHPKHAVRCNECLIYYFLSRVRSPWYKMLVLHAPLCCRGA